MLEGYGGYGRVRTSYPPELGGPGAPLGVVSKSPARVQNPRFGGFSEVSGNFS